MSRRMHCGCCRTLLNTSSSPRDFPINALAAGASGVRTRTVRIPSSRGISRPPHTGKMRYRPSIGPSDRPIPTTHPSAARWGASGILSPRRVRSHNSRSWMLPASAFARYDDSIPVTSRLPFMTCGESRTACFATAYPVANCCRLCSTCAIACRSSLALSIEISSRINLSSQECPRSAGHAHGACNAFWQNCHLFQSVFQDEIAQKKRRVRSAWKHQQHPGTARSFETTPSIQRAPAEAPSQGSERDDPTWSACARFPLPSSPG